MTNTTSKVSLGDVGVYVEVEFKGLGSGVDISTATTREIWVRKPDGTKLAWTASFTTDGTDNKIRYATGTGDLDLAGEWRIRGHVEGPSLVRTTQRGIIDVLDTEAPS